MSVEGLQRLAAELEGSTNPPFKVFGERIREELEGVQDAREVQEVGPEDVGSAAEVLQGAGDTPDEQTPEEPQDDEAPLPEEAPGPSEETEGETQDQHNARVHGMDPH